MELTFSFFTIVVLSFIALFPAVNPIGKAFVVDGLINELGPQSRKFAALKIAFYCFTICAGTILVGDWIFKLFGISIPVVQIAGGIMICKMGWELLSGQTGPHSASQETKITPEQESRIEDTLFYPIAFPTTTGAGTISVLFTLGARAPTYSWDTHLVHLSALLLATGLMSLAIFLCYAFTPRLLKKLGPHGVQIVNRLSAFLVFCVGIQILVSGIKTIFKL